jgi:xanthine dehydrogenase accessory factor
VELQTERRKVFPGRLNYHVPMKTLPDSRPDPWRFALDAVEADQRAVLVMVVDHSGSVPGVTGTMVVVTTGGQAGTIGGGAAEHRMVDLARRHRGAPELVDFVHTEKGDGTLCNGVQRFSVVPLSRRDAPAVEKIVRALENHETGSLRLAPNGLSFERGSIADTTFVGDDDDWTFTHPIGLLDTLTIIGGGHVASALSRVMATLPFRIAVLDNRDNLQTMGDNPFAHRKEVVDYDRIAEYVPEGERSWVVVMTFGHRHDRKVVEGLLGSDVRYLGLMGSAAKVKRLFADMEADGADPASLARVRAPIGVPIRSHTPEEIAVSVAAEIIAIRNGARN